MIVRRALIGFAAAALLVAPPAANEARAAGADEAAVGFVNTVGNQLIAVINGAGSEPEKRAALTRIIDASVDVDGVARFCLGRFWRTANAAEQRGYLDAFRVMLVNNITGAMGGYKGVKFTVGRAQPRADGQMVSTTIERPDNAPAPVDWLIAQVGGSPKIEDMITEGVSLRLTQRSDYESFLAGNGHTVRTLIEGLRQKAAAHA